MSKKVKDQEEEVEVNKLSEDLVTSEENPTADIEKNDEKDLEKNEESQDVEKENESDDDIDEDNVDKNKELADEYLGRLQRLQAEFDNFRRREEKQRLSLKDMVVENVMQEMLPVIDNFERATHASKNENTTLESFVEGMDLVYKQFEGFLTNFDVKRMDVLGEKFNPEVHDAVSKAHSDEYEEDYVSQVLQNGWTLNDKVIRHAMVVVSSGEEEKKEN